MKRFFFSSALGLLLCMALGMQAQVSIGKATAPNAGALLDLKELDATNGAANATKGLGLPRVNITNLTPDISVAGALAASIGSVGEWNAQAHIGLTVYNINEGDACATTPNAKGIHVWDGTQWQALDASAGTTLGVGVMQHPAKEGYYEAFTSAQFGTAGRWMTTNLAATRYDGIEHSTHAGASPRNLAFLTESILTSGLEVNMAYWCYPNIQNANPLLPDEYNKNKALGYLYTWDAATAGKGGKSGEQNIDTTTPATLVPEDGYPENKLGNVDGQQKRRQGICPAGWHLPSDAEWTLLENELQMQTKTYSTTDNIGISTYPLAYVKNPSPASIGTVMKLPCPLPSAEDLPKGTSRGATQGGFAVLLAGYYGSGSSDYMGTQAYFWTSSLSGPSPSLIRSRRLLYDNISVYYGARVRKDMLSVRCKEDTPLD